MKKFYFIAVIIGTIFITIVSGCAVKTVDTKNVNQEMEISKKAPVVGKIPTKEKTIQPPIKKIIPDKIQLVAEMFYSFVAKMISDTAGSKAKPYFPFIFSLFMFVLLCNMVGMIPYTFTVTCLLYTSPSPRD